VRGGPGITGGLEEWDELVGAAGCAAPLAKRCTGWYNQRLPLKFCGRNEIEGLPAPLVVLAQVKECCLTIESGIRMCEANS
jgi:hypothetical protein